MPVIVVDHSVEIFEISHGFEVPEADFVFLLGHNKNI